MPSPGGIYTSPYPGGWQNGQAGATPLSAAAIDVLDAGIKTSLQAPTSPNDGDIPIWNASANGGSGGWDSSTNKKIAKSQLGALALTDSDIAVGAGIQLSKLNGFPSNSTVFARGDGTWAQPVAANVVNAADKSSSATQFFNGPLSTGPATAGVGFDGVIASSSALYLAGTAISNILLLSTGGDSQARLIGRSDGSVLWGSGFGAQDCTVERIGVGLLRLTSTGLVSSSSTAGIGYSTGAGGSVTQVTSKTSSVTINKICGQITMNNQALTGSPPQTAAFVVNNTVVAATDTVVVNLVSGYSGPYDVNVYGITANSFIISVTNNTGSSASDALVLSFAIIKAVNS